MTEDETEALVRETFRSREHLVAGRNQVDLLAKIEPPKRHGSGQPATGLPPPARFDRRLVATGATLVAVALIGGIVLAATGGPGGRSAGPSGGGPAAGGDAPAGWIWYSSLGMEIAVPAGWAVNDIGCNQTDRPTVVRARGAERLCLTPEVATKRVAEIRSGPDDTPVTGTTRDLTLDGVSATLTEGTLDDGRFAAQLAVPSHGIYLAVRTPDAAERTAILDTARLVEVDHLGCSVQRPVVTGPAQPAATLVPTTTESVHVCLYGGSLLAASAAASGTDAAWLVSAVNTAPAGRNPDRSPSSCVDTHPVAPEAVLYFDGPGDQVTRLWVTFSTCTDRGLDDGNRQAHVTAEMVQWLGAVLHTGMSHSLGH